MEVYKIPKELRDRVVNYLSTQPLGEVDFMFHMLQQLEPIVAPPAKVDEKPVEKSKSNAKA